MDPHPAGSGRLLHVQTKRSLCGVSKLIERKGRSSVEWGLPQSEGTQAAVWREMNLGVVTGRFLAGMGVCGRVFLTGDLRS